MTSPMGVPVVTCVPVAGSVNTPDRIFTASGSRRWLVKRECPGRRLSRKGWMSASLRGIPGGHPSTTQPIAGPWLSPNVVTRKRWPKVLKDINSCRPRFGNRRAERGQREGQVVEFMVRGRVLLPRPKRRHSPQPPAWRSPHILPRVIRFSLVPFAHQLVELGIPAVPEHDTHCREKIALSLFGRKAPALESERTPGICTGGNRKLHLPFQSWHPHLTPEDCLIKRNGKIEPQIGSGALE